MIVFNAHEVKNDLSQKTSKSAATDEVVSPYLIEEWGLIPYQEALERQLLRLDEVVQGNHPGSIIFCQHPRVVTLGRATQPGDVSSWKGEIIEVSRGGRATYHGPNQLVCYPIINLEYSYSARKIRDLDSYLRGMEQAMILTLKDLGIPAQGKSDLGDTGVWISEGTEKGKKIGSLGIAIKRWVTYHGIALNIFHDSDAFVGINPCGLSPHLMTSLETCLGHKPDLEFIQKLFLRHLTQYI